MFAIAFLLLAAAGLVFTSVRAPVYQAAATVLAVKPKAIDTQGAEADLERVAIQDRALLSEELLRDRLEKLKERFTTVYFERDPTLRVLPQELQELQAEVSRLKTLGQRLVIDADAAAQE